MFTKISQKSKQVKTRNKCSSKKSRKRAINKHKKYKRTVKPRHDVKNRRTRRIMRGGEPVEPVEPVAGTMIKTRIGNYGYRSVKTRFYIIQKNNRGNPELTYGEIKGVIPLELSTLGTLTLDDSNKSAYIEYQKDKGYLGKVELQFKTGNGYHWFKEHKTEKKRKAADWNKAIAHSEATIGEEIHKTAEALRNSRFTTPKNTREWSVEGGGRRK